MIEKKLGKLPARHDARTYKLTAPIKRPDISVPAEWDWSKGIRYDMSGNNIYGCCAFASRTAMLLTWTTLAQGPIRLNTAETLADYAQATGFNPKTGANDNGTILLDALNMWRREGFNRDTQTRDYLTAYAAIDHKDHDAVRRAIYVLGGVYLGIQVPKYLMELEGDWAYEPGADWTLVGGHCIAALGYDSFGPRIFTWGSTRRMSWELWDAIVDEAYGLISREDWLTRHGKTTIGLDVDELIEESKP